MKQRIKKERRITRYFLRRKMIVKKSFHVSFMFMEKPFRKNPQNLDKIAPNATDIRRNYQLPNDHRDIFGCPFSLLVTLDNSKKCIVFHQNPDKNINHISQVSIMTHCILLILSSSVLPFWVDCLLVLWVAFCEWLESIFSEYRNFYNPVQVLSFCTIQ